MPEELLNPVHELDGKLNDGAALCLSGGGYRAMLFHVGCLIRLNEAGLLGTLQRVSSVSGGSITAAVLGLQWRALGFNGGGSANPDRLNELVVAPIRKMASTTVDEGAILGGIFLPGSISDHVADKYDDVLYHGKTLQDLPPDAEGPRFILNATGVQSAVLVRFSRPYIWDYRVGQIKNPTLPIARAVAASSAFPPVLSPCEIEPADFGMRFEPPGPGEDLATDAYRRKMVLSDGGVYDNLGLETAFKRYKTLLVSDGGGHIEGEPKPAEDWARHSYRVLNVIDSQVRALRVRQLIELLNRKVRTGSYWSIRQEITTFGGSARLPCPADKTAQLAAVATRLKKLDNATQDRLINWGYAVCDASIRCFHIPDLADPKGFPYPGSGV